MKWLLISMLVCWLLTSFSYRSAFKPGDYGMVYQVFVCGAVSGVLTIAYFALAFWNHSFL